MVVGTNLDQVVELFHDLDFVLLELPDPVVVLSLEVRPVKVHDLLVW